MEWLSFFLQKDTGQTIESTQVKEVHTGSPSTNVQNQKPNKPTEETGIETDVTNKPDRHVNRRESQELKVALVVGNY